MLTKGMRFNISKVYTSNISRMSNLTILINKNLRIVNFDSLKNPRKH